MYDMLIVGGGPAGVSAALYAKARGHQIAILAQDHIGGLIQTVSKVSHYTGLESTETGLHFAGKLEQQLKDAQIPVFYEKVNSLNFTTSPMEIFTNQNTYTSKTVILAMGSRRKPLGIQGESLILSVAQGMGEEVAGKTVIVIGGADGAAKEALYLRRPKKCI